MSKVIPIHPAKDFKARSKAVLDNEGQRKNFRGAMDFLQAKRRSQFSDDDELQDLRNLGQAIRQYSLANLPRLEGKGLHFGIVIEHQSKGFDVRRFLNNFNHGRQFGKVGISAHRHAPVLPSRPGGYQPRPDIV